jgi:hypothetical protein
MSNIGKYLHDPLEDGGELHEQVVLLLAEPKLEDAFVTSVNKVDENDTVTIRL